jgi:hypothetical protein
MIYEIYLNNGWRPWLALVTSKKEEAVDFLEKTKAQSMYLRILTDKGSVVRMETQGDQWDMSRSQLQGLV